MEILHLHMMIMMINMACMHVWMGCVERESEKKKGNDYKWGMMQT